MVPIFGPQKWPNECPAMPPQSSDCKSLFVPLNSRVTVLHNGIIIILVIYSCNYIYKSNMTKYDVSSAEGPLASGLIMTSPIIKFAWQLFFAMIFLCREVKKTKINFWINWFVQCLQPPLCIFSKVQVKFLTWIWSNYFRFHWLNLKQLFFPSHKPTVLSFAVLYWH